MLDIGQAKNKNQVPIHVAIATIAALFWEVKALVSPTALGAVYIMKSMLVRQNVHCFAELETMSQQFQNEKWKLPLVDTWDYIIITA